jgi:hypothetical protein
MISLTFLLPVNWDADLQRMFGNETVDKRNGAFAKRQHPKLGNQEQLQKALLAAQLKPPPEHFPSDEICSTNRQWEQINSTHDFYDNDVEVVHEEGLQQFIYTYRCASNKSIMIAFNHYFTVEFRLIN